MIDDDTLRQIAARLQQATPGPWTIGFDKSLRSAWAVQKAETTRIVVHLDPDKNIDLDVVTNQVEPDLEFIQNAPADVELLLEEVRELREQVEADRQTKQDMSDLQATFQQMASNYERVYMALRWYADPANADGGKIARRVLGIPEPAGTSETPAQS